MERVVEEALSKVWFKLQQIRVRIFTQFSFIAGLMNLEDESNESNKTFYFLSLMLLISLIFLSPDKVPQTFSQGHAEAEILEKMQDITKIIRKLMSNLV